MIASHGTSRCGECGAIVPPGFSSCKDVFEGICSIEYADPQYGAVHLLTVDAYALQHSAERGPRSNAFHLLRLCRMIEHGDSPAIGRRPPRGRGKAFEEDYRGFPNLAPPEQPGVLTISDVFGATGSDEHAQRVWRYGRGVWLAWAVHHAWARDWASRATSV